MADEIAHLQAKFTDGLGSDTDNKLPCRTQFEELKNMIEEKVKQIPSLSNNKLKLLREKLHELNNILAECQKLSRGRKFYNFPREMFFIHGIKNRLTKIKEDLQKEPKEQNGSAAAQNNSNNSSQPIVKKKDFFRWSNQSVEYKVIGFEDEVVAMEKMVLERENPDSFKGIGIVGKGGIGKTTLAQVIFNKKEVKEQFLPRIWVPMSKQGDKEENTEKEIVKRMLVSLGAGVKVIREAESKGIACLLYALQLQLRGKRYLIVLDDVWDTNQWYANLGAKLPDVKKLGEQLAYGFPKGYGGTVIVTSREEEVVKNMVGIENMHRISPLLNPENVWSIFMESLKTFWVKSKEVDHSMAFTYEEEVIILESEILQRPNPNEFKGIGIFGQGDSGKTKLVQEVFEKPKVIEHFHSRIWVSMSKQQDDTVITDKQIVKKMLKSLEVGDKVIEEADDNSGLLSLLQLQLKGQRYLIVIDDIWNSANATMKDGEMGSWIEEIRKWGEGYGGTVIVTSGDEGIAAEMVGEENVYGLPHTFTKKEHVWSIFINSARKTRSDGEKENLKNYFEMLKDDILEKCNGLPLSAKVMGQLMYEQIQDKSVRADETHTNNVTVTPPVDVSQTHGVAVTTPPVPANGNHTNGITATA